MVNGNFAVEILRAPVQGINRLEWKGGKNIPEVAAALSPPAFFSVTSPLGFQGRIHVTGDIEHYEKDNNKWTFRWSELAERRRSGQGAVIFKHEDVTRPDIIVSVLMSPESGLTIKYPPLTFKQVAITIAIAVVLAIALVVALRLHG